MTDKPSSLPDRPLVSVLLCTFNRKGNVLPTAQSVRACGYPNFELFVLDQSRDDATERAVFDLCREDARIRYLRLPRPSKPEALNQGRALALGHFILLTDDDCEVKPGWIDAALQTFRSNERIGCVFGDVDAGPYDSAQGFVPVCRITHAHTIFTVSDYLRMPGWQNSGMGANMALRAEALSAIGGWDPCIGPGAHFASGDDNDAAVRILRAGYGVAFSPDARVTHFGLRRWDATVQDQVRYGFGSGAIFAKLLRCGTFYPGPLRVFAKGLRDSTGRLLARDRHLGLAFPRNFVRGAWAGLRHPLDHGTQCFVPSTRLDGGLTDALVANVVLRVQQAEGDGAEGCLPQPKGVT